MRPPIYSEQCGYDYAQAVRELNQRFSYELIAQLCGYARENGVRKIANGGTIPSHPLGEALYILYVETFERKPPHKRYSSAELTTA